MHAFRLFSVALAALFALGLSAQAGLAAECEEAPPVPYALYAKNLTEWLKLPERVVVDVRAEAGHNVLRIPGSLNFPAFSLKYKEYLKDKSLLIIGAAQQRRSLFTVCEDLHKRSFKDVRVLVGGIKAWQKAGLDLAGDKTTLGHIQAISPTDLVIEFRGEQPRIITPQIGETEALLGSLGTYTAWPDLDHTPNIGSRLTALVAAGPAARPIIFLPPDSVKDSELESIFDSQRLGGLERDLFYVKGGYSALVEALKLNAHLLDGLKKLEEPKVCR